MAGAHRLAKLWSTYTPYMLGITSNAGFNIILISLLTHRLIPAVYGDYSVSVTAIVLISSTIGQWLQQATGRYLAGSAARASCFTKAAILLGVGGILLALAVLCLLAAFFNLVHQTAVSQLLMVVIVSVAAQTLFTLVGTILQSEQRAWSYALQQTSVGGLKIGFSLIACGISQRSIGGLLYACAAAQCLGVAYGASRAGLLDMTVLEKLKSRRTRVVLRKLRVYGGTMTLWFIFMNLAMYCDRLLVRVLAGSETAGLYGAASTLVVGSVNLVMAPVLAATWPQLMAAWNARNEAAATRLLGNLLTALLCAGVALVAIVSAVAEPATHLFLGEKFSAAKPLLPLLAASAFSFSLGPFFHKPLEFKEMKITMCIFAASALLLNAVLSVALTPWLGGVGAGVAALLAGSTYCVLCALRGRAIASWRIRLDMLAVVTIAGGIAYFAARSLSASWRFNSNLSKFAATGIGFSVAFGAGLGIAVLLQAYRRRPQTQTFE
ncbi:lipopolysaccharide biosynthesis protein [Paraburkholderia terrae]|uniref:lipopolysaccharide biosynthesis protein n=1 Tax=Paraburkholderia terrae TaxID=311230 RepID=UPI001E39592F|nr:lipopolysaccharide biosynthesis protein [Paraburkholderia terrae]